MNILGRISETEFVRSAIEDQADLSAFKDRPSMRIYMGLGFMALSYVIGWPAVGGLGFLAIHLDNPLIVVVGGPVVYGLSHLVFMLGMFMAGTRYAKVFMRWATRKAMEKLMGNQRIAEIRAGSEDK